MGKTRRLRHIRRLRWVVVLSLAIGTAQPIGAQTSNGSARPVPSDDSESFKQLQRQIQELQVQIQQMSDEHAQKIQRLQSRIQELETRARTMRGDKVTWQNQEEQPPRVAAMGTAGLSSPGGTGSLSSSAPTSRVDKPPVPPDRASAVVLQSAGIEDQQTVPSEDLQQEIDSALQELEQAEPQRAQPAPELGAGLGARLAAFNPNISVIGDFLGVVSNAPDAFEGDGIPLAGFEEGDVDGFTFREIELLMSSAIDPYSDGLLKLAFGEEGVEIEEAYILFHDYPFRHRLPDWLQDVHTKAGIFRMAFGPMNLVDDHDMPTVDRPLAIQRFLGEEGLIRAGVSFSKLLPLSEALASELTLEFTNGEPIGDEEGAPPFAGVDHPLGLVHYKIFREREPDQGWEERLNRCGRLGVRDGYRSLELGTTFAATGSRVEGGGEDLYSLVQGVDLTWQWYDPRPDVYRQYLFQWELFVSELDQAGDGVRGDVGTYLLGQIRLNRQWFTGLRFDITEFPERDGFQLAASPFVTFFFSEFNRLRLQYQYLRQEIEVEGSEDVHSLLLQLVFAFGAHPPEPYYIRQRY